MTRGRKKDLTIPASRALAQQRDYRARKAQYVSNLEARCRSAEEENARLKKELDLARAGAPSVFSHQTAEASADLLKHLAATTLSLSNFHQLAFPGRSPPQVSQTPHTTLHPASFPSPAPSEPPTLYSRSSDEARPSKRTYSQSSASDSEMDINKRHHSDYFSRGARSPERSPSLGSECCGGFMDCTDLVEEEQDELEEDEDDDPEDYRTPASPPVIRTSEIRSSSSQTVTHGHDRFRP